MRCVMLLGGRRRFSVLCLVLLLGVVILPSFQPAPAAQTTPPGEGERAAIAEPREPIGLRVRAIGGLLPIGTFRVGTTIHQPAFGFSAGGDISYRLPFDEVGIDVGIGSKYNFERLIDGQGGAAYSTIPLYFLVGLPFALPDVEVFGIFLEGRIGYSFFLVNDAFRNDVDLLNGNDPEGNLYWAIGIGAEFNITPAFFASVAINYGSGGGATSTTTITNETFDIEIGLGYTF